MDPLKTSTQTNHSILLLLYEIYIFWVLNFEGTTETEEGAKESTKGHQTSHGSHFSYLNHYSKSQLRFHHIPLLSQKLSTIVKPQDPEAVSDQLRLPHQPNHRINLPTH